MTRQSGTDRRYAERSTETTMVFSSFHRFAVAATGAALLLAAGVAHSTGSRATGDPSRTAAEEAFADAPYGVDPIVTGPTSASFTTLQKEAGCASAVWPDIPLICYPGR